MCNEDETTPVKSGKRAKPQNGLPIACCVRQTQSHLRL